MRNVLYRALGQVEETEPDLYSRSLNEGDRLILCSDGLTRHVKPAEIAEIAKRHDEPEAIAQDLIDLANERGGEDNISVVVIALEHAQDIPKEQRPDPLLYDETDLGLYQEPPDDSDPERSTLELPAADSEEDDTLTGEDNSPA